MGKGKKRSKKLPDDAELLVELATLDEVEAWIPTAADHQAGITPTWCELVLGIKRNHDRDDEQGPGGWPIHQNLALRRHDGELIIQVLGDVLHRGMSNSAGDALWAEMDKLMERIQRRVRAGRKPMTKHVNQALGLATAMAIMDNPLEPDLDEIRVTAMARYCLRHNLPFDADDD